jgi:hypothetical protein
MPQCSLERLRVSHPGGVLRDPDAQSALDFEAKPPTGRVVRHKETVTNVDRFELGIDILSGGKQVKVTVLKHNDR